MVNYVAECTNPDMPMDMSGTDSQMDALFDVRRYYIMLEGAEWFKHPWDEGPRTLSPPFHKDQTKKMPNNIVR